MIITEKEVKLKNDLSIVLRSPTPSDANLLLDNLQCVLHESYKNMNDPADHYDNFPIEEEIKILENFSNANDRFMISAFHLGKIVGNLGVVGNPKEISRHCANIGMGIRKEYQGVGLGYQLLKYAIEASRLQDFKRLELTVRTFNTAGVKLYEKVGFQRIGRLNKKVFIDGEFHDEFSYQLLL